MEEKMARKLTIVVVLAIVFLVAGMVASYALISSTGKEVIEDKEVNEVKEDIRPDLTQYYSDYKNYEDIRNLSKEYSVESAIADGCFVITDNGTHNDSLYSEFLTSKANRQNAYLRVVGYPGDGSKILYDIKYNPIEDNSRMIYYDFDTNPDSVTIVTYDHVEEIDHEGHSYFVAYDGQETAWEDMLVIAIIF